MAEIQKVEFTDGILKGNLRDPGPAVLQLLNYSLV